MDITNIALAFFAVAVLAFITATAFGFGPGGPDADEIEEAKALLADKEAVLVDVRTPREFADNGFDGAANIPLQQLPQRSDELGAKDEPVVLYCRSGNRSNQARRILEGEGFETIYDLGAYRTARQVVEAIESDQ